MARKKINKKRFENLVLECLKRLAAAKKVEKMSYGSNNPLYSETFTIYCMNLNLSSEKIIKAIKKTIEESNLGIKPADDFFTSLKVLYKNTDELVAVIRFTPCFNVIHLSFIYIL